MKVLQLGGGLGVVLPATQLLGGSTVELASLAALSCGALGVASSCSWYCERIVQELRVLDRSRLRVSTLTMWGHRRDREFELAACEPTFGPGGPEAQEASKAFVPLHISGTSFMLIKHPLNMVDPQAVNRLLCGLHPFAGYGTSAATAAASRELRSAPK
eukprot:scaffold60919_cov41-Tisochrysis_lutea.AAC.2